MCLYNNLNMRRKAIKYIYLWSKLITRGIGMKDVAELLNVTPRTVTSIFNGSSELSLKGAFMIRDKWFPGMTIDELYKDGMK